MKKLSREEMKLINGGINPLTLLTKWNCYDHDGAGPYVNCRSTNPVSACGYARCNNIGTCNQQTNCS